MFPNLNCTCTFLEAAPKVSQSQPESDVPISKPFPVMGGHPVPESGKIQHDRFGLYLRVSWLSCSFLRVMFCCTCPLPYFLYGLPFPPVGAILPLTLGLIITALLLLMIGCRLKLVRHKLKKARPLTTEESDYLINGMYL